MDQHVLFIASVITEDPDIFVEENQIILEASVKNIAKLLDKLQKHLDYDLNQAMPNREMSYKNAIANFAVNEFNFNELGISKWVAREIANNIDLLRYPNWQEIADFLQHQYVEGIEFNPKQSFDDIVGLSEEWHIPDETSDQPIQYGGEPVMHVFPDGYRIVELSKKEHCDAEGAGMGHCVSHGGYDPETVILYSLRDRNKNPHVTVELQHNGKINQIKGKKNEPPVKKYSRYILPWLDRQFSFPDQYTSTGMHDYISSIFDEERLERVLQEDSWELTSAIARNPNITAEDVLEHASDKTIKEYVKLTNNLDNLMIFAKNPRASVRAAVAGNYSLSERAAAGESTAVSISSMLMEDPRTIVRAALATVTKDEAILSLLANDPSDKVKEAVIKNGKTPGDVFFELTDDPDLLFLIAQSTKIPLEIADLLSESEDEEIRVEIAKRLKETLVSTEYSIPYTRRAEAREKFTAIGNRLANDSSANVRSAIASNAWGFLNEDSIEQLVNDPNDRVRLTLVKSHDIPREHAITLTNDKNFKIASLAQSALEQIDEREMRKHETRAPNAPNDASERKAKIEKLRQERERQRLQRHGWIE